MALPLDENQILILKEARREIQALDKQQLKVFKIKSQSPESALVFEYVFNRK
jgi:hypothetical protein